MSVNWSLRDLLGFLRTDEVLGQDVRPGDIIVGDQWPHGVVRVEPFTAEQEADLRRRGCDPAVLPQAMAYDAWDNGLGLSMNLPCRILPRSLVAADAVLAEGQRRLRRHPPEPPAPSDAERAKARHERRHGRDI